MADFDRPLEIRDVSYQLPLYDALLALDAEIRHRYPAPEDEYGDGVDALGVSFSESGRFARGRYWCTPLNTLAFAWTGGDGEHFSFLVTNDRIDEKTPIVLTAPTGNDVNLIIAPDFQTFLRIGIHQSLFSLSQFAYAKENALQACDREAEAAAKGLAEIGRSPSTDWTQAVRAFVAKRLNLQPYWYSSQAFEELQSRANALVMSQEYRETMGE